MDLGIPETAYATGGIYEFDDGRTVPDTCSALFNYPSHKLTVSFTGCSTNAYMNKEACYRGSEGTMELSQSRLRLYAEGKNDLFTHFAPPDGAVKDLRIDPVFEERSSGNSTTAHLDDFFLAVKNGGPTRAPIEQCFKAMVAVAMALQSYQSGKSVRWDAEHERIETGS
jgi:predicted dehydrogenase